MSFDPRNDPRWLAAVVREREIREGAYLGLPTPIADGAMELAPLTLRQQTILFASRNPIACTGDASEEDAVAFLWAVDPAYAPDNEAGRAALFARLRELNLDWTRVIDELRAWYLEQTLDSPKPPAIKRATTSAPAVSGTALYITILWSEGCPLGRDAILDSPVACLNQERRAFSLQKPRHGIVGGALSNAVERELILERRTARAAGQ